MDLCLQEKFIENCHCYNPAIPSMFSNNPCKSAEEILCMYKYYQNFISKDPRDMCNYSMCPLECETNSYPVSVTTSDFCPRYLKFLYDQSILKEKNPGLGKDDIEKIRKKVLAVNVYYPDLSYTNITQLEKLSWVDVISGFGGFSGKKLFTFY